MGATHIFSRNVIYLATTCWLTLLFLPMLVRAAEFELGDFELDEKQLKNTVYGQGFSIGLDEKAIDKLIEIQELLKQSQWIKAFRLIDDNRALWAGKQVPRKDGFSFPVNEYLWRLIASLPPDALESFRLYFDPKAAALLAKSESVDPAAELEALREIYEIHFFTKAGAKAANRLADALFQQGNFRRAAKIWTQIVDHHPTVQNELNLQCKRAIAYYRAGDEESNAEVLLTLMQRFADKEINFGGNKQSVVSFGEAWVLDPSTQRTSDHILELVAVPKGEPTCDVSFRSESSTNTLIPGVHFENDIAYVNQGRIQFAYDVKTGRSLWGAKRQKGNFLKLIKSIATQVQERITNPFQQNEKPGKAELEPASDDNYVYMMHFEDVNSPTLRAFEKKSGEIAWEPKIDDARLIGNILPVHEGIAVCAYGVTTTNELSLIWIAKDGTVQKRLKLGSVQPKSNPYQGTTVQPSPVLISAKNYVFVLPNDGALLAIDAADKIVEWTYRYAEPRRDLAGDTMMFVYNNMAKTYYRASAKIFDQILYFKDDEKSMLHAIDPYQRKVIWKRTANSDTELIGVDDQSVYVLEKESNGVHNIVSYDRKSNRFMKVFRLPEHTSPKIVNGRENILASTNRGVYQINKDTWEWDFPYREGGFRIGPGDLIVKDGWLVSTNHLSLQAYRLTER